jgi:SAM-dependent methyltransferase
MVTAATERFGNRADAYTRGRPTYPPAIVAHLEQTRLLRPGATVVDLGVGTGLSAEPFLLAGFKVIGVEPNAAMRAAGDEHLQRYASYRSVAGTAEQTSLPEASADLVIAGPAFHWFEPERAAIAARRILRPGSAAALIWNDRPATGSAFLEGYEALLRTHGIDYEKVTHRHIDEAAIARFFAPASAQVAFFDNPRLLDRDALAALINSASYMPAAGDPRHVPMIAAMDALFDAHAKSGSVRMLYRTRMHYAKLNQGD